MKSPRLIPGDFFIIDQQVSKDQQRLPESLLEHIKKIADEKKIPYTRLIRQILELVVGREQHSRVKQ